MRLRRNGAGMASQLYYGDNLDVLRKHIADASVDLIYLDPPFNSNADYNALFKTPKGQNSPAQMEIVSRKWWRFSFAVLRAV